MGLTIGQLAKRAGVNIETVRYYERRGLLPRPPRRADGGYRLYGDEYLARLGFIRRSQRLGFSLKEIKDLLALRVNARASCDDVRRRAADKITDIDERLAELTRMRAALVRLAAACRGRGPTAECPILDALAAEEER